MESMIYMNRELSWLKFNERVLEEAEREQVPLCERWNFLSIYQSNLDEFFMVRVGTLLEQENISPDLRDNKTHLTAHEQMEAILRRVAALERRRDLVYEALLDQLRATGLTIVNFDKLGKRDASYLEHYFDKAIAPLLSPSILSKRQPFPFLRGQEIYVLVVLERKNGKERIGVVPCGSNVFPRLIEVPSHPNTYMLSEELLLHFAPKVFHGFSVKAKSLLRVTRSADIDADALYEEGLDYRDFMEALIKKRRRLAPVRLELSRTPDNKIVQVLCEQIKVERSHVFYRESPLDMSFVAQIRDILRQDAALFYPRRVPQRSSAFVSGVPLLEQIAREDKLLLYPYESMRPMLALLREAANDEAVISIKMTLYRVAKQSKVVEALIEAAENGKDVLVLVELKARFDEANNIDWSRRLEAAGCTVIYGIDGYKVHSKLCLITRRGHGQNEYFTQIGTGNYNENTARLYTDFSLLTADPEIGIDAARIFQALALGETMDAARVLAVAPCCLQSKLIALIDEQIDAVARGEQGYIGLKMNSLTDITLIDKLVQASCAGVKIDMIVRGICCLIAGIEGKTENIRVISIVGRYLEHSRLYLFGTGDERKVYIASADLMTRNTLRRIEVAAPVRDAALKKTLCDLFDLMLRDNRQARELRADGNYVRVIQEGLQIDAQNELYRQAYARAGNRDSLVL